MAVIATRPTLPRWAGILLTLAGLVILVAGMRAASSILVPFLVAAFLSVIASGPLFWLERKGVPSGLAVPIVVLGILVVGVGIGALVGTSLDDFNRALPAYQAQPFGFMALLGLLSLSGMLIKNAIVLIDQIGIDIGGASPPTRPSWIPA